MSDNNSNEKITCPECQNEFEYDITGLEVGDIVECPICGTNLEIMDTNPVQVESIVLHK